MKQPKLSILYPYFYPGYKAGGITQSLYNLSILLSRSYEIQVLCLNHDFCTTKIYSFIADEGSIQKIGENITVIYLEEKTYFKTGLKYLNEFLPDFIYVNSIYDVGFLSLGLYAAKKNGKKVVIAPRGMLHGGSLKKGTFKKQLYLSVLNKFLQLNKLVWHATDEQEIIDIKKWFSTEEVHLATDTPRPLPLISNTPERREETELKLVYYSLITSKKNLLLLLKALLKIKVPASLDIYGPVIEENYWQDCVHIINQLKDKVDVKYLKNVPFSEFQKNAHQYHYLVLPSKGENFGHVIYESLSLSLPIMISKFTPWDFKNGSVGFYVDLNVNDIAEVINKAYNIYGSEYAAMADAARQTASNFYNKMAQNYYDKYANIFSIEQNLAITKPQQTIAVLYEYFYPGYKAGGPIQSLVNMIEELGNVYDFRVITTAFDLNDTIPYKGIKLNSWNNIYLPLQSTHPVQVWYSSSKHPSIIEIAGVIKKLNPDVLFINGFYTEHFVYPLLLKKLGFLNSNKRVIVSPRGMSQSGALAIRYYEKTLFLLSIKMLKLNKGVIFHASSQEEAKDIIKLFGTKASVKVAGNIPKKPNYLNESEKITGVLRLVYLSVITPKKNLLLLLQSLNKCSENIFLDIYGPIKEITYWKKCEKLIKLLPQNISVVYKKDIAALEVQKKLSEYDALILPTRGENFGHALYESLSVGTPIITSIYTPWQNLQSKNAGWNIEVLPNSLPQLNELLTQLVACHKDDWKKYKEGAWQLAKDYYYNQSFKKDYELLFVN